MSLKRFTETEKWRDAWFQGLTPIEKLFWLYVCDNCDSAGVWEINWRHAGFVIGAEINNTILQAFKGRMFELQDRYLVIVKFVVFQTKGMSLTDSPPHWKIKTLLAKHGLEYLPNYGTRPFGTQDENNRMPMDMRAIAQEAKAVVERVESVATKPYAEVTTVAAPEVNGNHRSINEELIERTLKLKKIINQIYRRPQEQLWNNVEERLLCVIARRDNVLDEARLLREFRNTMDDPKYFASSVVKLLDPENWQKKVDEARTNGVTLPVEKFGTPTSKRIKLCGVIFTREDGGPRREQFGKSADQQTSWEFSRKAYDAWLANCLPVEDEEL